MVGHQAIRNNTCAILLSISCNQIETVAEILIVEENRSAIYSTIVDMVMLTLRKHVSTLWHTNHLIGITALASMGSSQTP